MLARMKKEHKIVVGHWKSERVQKKIGDWMITAIGLVESNHLRVARFADNMLNVADTDLYNRRRSRCGKCSVAE